MTLHLSSTQVSAACPLCQRSSHRVHSSYERTLRDLNWAECAVTLVVTVRKLFCDHPDCQRRIFSERIPQLVVPWARRTNRMTQHLQDTGLALGGSAGARLLQKQDYSFSRDTILRCLMRLPFPAIPLLKQVGVDDFAFTKRRRYGTILVDLERHRPIALLRDREAETLTQWLEQHPGIEILSRDRSATYRSGMNQGAPEAIQVADRFHLLQNLREGLEQALSQRNSILKVVDTAQRRAEVPEGTVVARTSETPVQPMVQQRAEQRRQNRLKTYQKVWQLHRKGWSLKAIAQKVKLSSRTVQRYLLTPSFPERQGRSDRGRSLINPYKAYLLQQYNQGRRQVKVLFREIQTQGYRGSYMTVTRYVRQLAQAQGVTLRQYPTGRRLPLVVDSARPALTARRAAFLVLRRIETLSSENQQLVQRLAQQAELADIIGLAQDFAQLVRQRQPKQLAP